MYMSARVIREHWELLKLGRNFSFIPFVENNQLRPFATRMWLPVQRLCNLWLPVSALEQNSRLGLGTRLRLPLLVNTIARDISYIHKWRKVCLWNRRLIVKTMKDGVIME